MCVRSESKHHHAMGVTGNNMTILTGQIDIPVLVRGPAHNRACCHCNAFCTTNALAWAVGAWLSLLVLDLLLCHSYWLCFSYTCYLSSPGATTGVTPEKLGFTPGYSSSAASLISIVSCLQHPSDNVNLAVCDPAAMGGVEDVASKAVLENPPQPVGTAPPPPTPRPPPPPPLNSNLGGRVVVPNQDVEASAAAAGVGDRQVDEAQAAQEGGFASRTSGAGQTLNLSRELVPIAAAGEVPPDDTPNYYDWQDLFPELKALVDGLSEIAAECAQVAAWKAWPEKHYDEGGGQDWKVRFGSMGYKKSHLGCVACQ